MGKFQVTLEDGSKYVVTTEGSKEETSGDRFLPGAEKVRTLEQKRVDPVQRLKEEVSIPPKGDLSDIIKYGVTGLKTAIAPVERASAGIGGLGLGLQEGKSFKESLLMGREGVLGQKQYRAGDPVTAATGSELAGVSTELGIQLVAPLKVIKDSMQFFGKIQKMSDPKMIKIGQNLINATEESKKVMGSKLDKIYESVSEIKIDSGNLINDLAELPQAIVKSLEKGLGNLDDFLSDFTVSKARALKQALAELKPSSFGKEKMGAVELAIDKDMSRVYGNVKNLIQGGLKKINLDQEANKLLEADEAYTEVRRASDFIKKLIVERTLRKPTKIGSLNKKYIEESDLSARTALNTLKEASLKSRANINKAVRALDQFNFNKFLSESAKWLGRATVIGATAGAAARRIEEVSEQ